MVWSAEQPGDAASTPSTGPAVLLTTSCTTGWADWVHGELWLCPDGLLRLSLGLATTIRKSFRASSALAYDVVARRESPRNFDQDEIGALLARKRTNIWVPWIQIREAALRRGIITSRLGMTLIDGRTVKFLWLPDRQTFDTLRDHLLARIGANLRMG